VSGLERDFPGKVTARNVDASEAEARSDIKSLGFKSHGLVVRSSDGTVLFKQPDHKVEIGSVQQALREILET